MPCLKEQYFDNLTHVEAYIEPNVAIRRGDQLQAKHIFQMHSRTNGWTFASLYMTRKLTDMF